MRGAIVRKGCGHSAHHTQEGGSTKKKKLGVNTFQI